MAFLLQYPKLTPTFGAILLVFGLSVAPCADETTNSPPTVAVLKLATHPIAIINELPGRIAATRIAEVRAQVSGIIQERVFEQGSHVKAGDLLYRIDPRLFRARVASAVAMLQKAEAVLANARQQYERQKELRARNVASGASFDAAEATLAQSKAEVALANAALEEARINLGYTEVRAPISGVIGAALVTEGALVSTSEVNQNLARIEQINPVYVDFMQSSAELRALKRAVDEGRLGSPTAGQACVELVFDDGSVYPHAGKLLFSSANVETMTGQITLRAEFSNPNGDLLPGLYVRVRIKQAIQDEALTVPQRAVLRTQEGRPQVYVVSADGIVEARDIRLGPSLGSDWVVDAGLKNGEQIIIDGIQKAQAGQKVTAEAWSRPGDASIASEDNAATQISQ